MQSSTDDLLTSALAAYARAVPPNLDHVALALVLIQAALLYKIARQAEGLRGPRLVAAAQHVRAKLTAQQQRPEAASPPATAVSAPKQQQKKGPVAMDSLDPRQRTMLERARARYIKEGDSLDALWEPFLLRFLVAAEWNEAEATRRMLACAAWRKEVGAQAVRQKFASGFKVASHPAMSRMLDAMGIAMCHRRTYDGDLFQLGHVGSFDPERWLRNMSDDEYNDLSLHFMEYLSYTADALSASEKRLVRHAFLLDYDGLAWKHLSMSIFLRLRPQILILGAHFPEMIGSGTCVNAPSLFAFLWSIVSPALSQSVRKRVQTVDASETASVVAKLGPPSSLPKTLGGTCEVMPDDVKDALGVDEHYARLRGFYDDGAWKRTE